MAALQQEQQNSSSTAAAGQQQHISSNNVLAPHQQLQQHGCTFPSWRVRKRLLGPRTSRILIVSAAACSVPSAERMYGCTVTLGPCICLHVACNHACALAVRPSGVLGRRPRRREASRISSETHHTFFIKSAQADIARTMLLGPKTPCQRPKPFSGTPPGAPGRGSWGPFRAPLSNF